MRATLLLVVPVPPESLLMLGTPEAGARLQALGLWDRHEDLCDPSQVVIALNPLVRPRLQAMAEAEAREQAALIAPALEQAWGGLERKRRSARAQIALAELALRGQQAAIIARTMAWALYYLQQDFERKRAGVLAEAAVRCCEAQQQELPLRLHNRASQALFDVGGDPALTEELLKRALRAYEQSEREGKGFDKGGYGDALWRQGLLQER